MKLSLTFLATVFAGVVVADMHNSCACHNGGYNWRITAPACDAYGSDVAYNNDSGRCESKSGDEVLDGDTWEGTCQKLAQEGFACIDGKGTCYASADTVRGDCN
ncbi:hypothetical protein KVR01_012770 [Diaporthe batatas]|uniref:uncharacterized protein n=1 Tax=Diaporthe batatas TaxID=748121 RepID=UPI001D04FC66|nr:uncharacterized protein KVR01_012770 [Diaporthe batatas]KAG8157386.1 hypothetical protein KVR01_012770 [Diaporthe batatas]